MRVSAARVGHHGQLGQVFPGVLAAVLRDQQIDQPHPDAKLVGKPAKTLEDGLFGFGVCLAPQVIIR